MPILASKLHSSLIDSTRADIGDRGREASLRNDSHASFQILKCHAKTKSGWARPSRRNYRKVDSFSCKR